MTSRRVHIIYLSLLSLSLVGYLLPEKLKLPTAARSPASAIAKMIGSVERIHFGESKGLQYFAKIDSGAETSSIHARNISTFRKIENGDAVLYVEFDTIDEKLQKRTIIKKVVKVDEVKNAMGKTQRYFINEKIWIGEDSYLIQINLADRSHLKRKFLLGKNALDDRYLIDTGSRMLTSR